MAGQPPLSCEDCSPYQEPSAISPVGDRFKDPKIGDLEKRHAPKNAASLLRRGPGYGDATQGCPSQAAGGEKAWPLSFRGTGPAGELWQEEKAPLQPPLWLYQWLEVKTHRKIKKDAQPLLGPGRTWWNLAVWEVPLSRAPGQNIQQVAREL